MCRDEGLVTRKEKENIYIFSANDLIVHDNKGLKR